MPLSLMPVKGENKREREREKEKKRQQKQGSVRCRRRGQETRHEIRAEEAANKPLLAVTYCTNFLSESQPKETEETATKPKHRE
jgi:hypothetical protein